MLITNRPNIFSTPNTIITCVRENYISKSMDGQLKLISTATKLNTKNSPKCSPHNNKQ